MTLGVNRTTYRLPEHNPHHRYVIGGETWSGKKEPCSWDNTTDCNINLIPIHGVEQFTPATGAWVPVSPLPLTRAPLTLT